MSSYAIDVLDPMKRASEKQASRERDRERLVSGQVNRDDLRRENGLFSSIPLQQFHIASIGGRPVGRVR